MKSNKIFKRIMTSALVLTMVMALSISSFAGSISRTYSGSFASDWMNSVDSMENGSKVVLTYGYNTSFINEDMAYSLYYGAEHRSKIRNGSKTAYGPKQRAGEWSDLEIRHSGSSVTYYSTW